MTPANWTNRPRSRCESMEYWSKRPLGVCFSGKSCLASIGFSHVNQVMTKKEMTKLIDAVYREVGLHDTVKMLDKLKDLGFYYATKAGVSLCIDNMHIPTKKEVLLGQGAQGRFRG